MLGSPQNFDCGTSRFEYRRQRIPTTIPILFPSSLLRQLLLRNTLAWSISFSSSLLRYLDKSDDDDSLADPQSDRFPVPHTRSRRTAFRIQLGLEAALALLLVRLRFFDFLIEFEKPICRSLVGRIQSMTATVSSCSLLSRYIVIHFSPLSSISH